MAFNYPKITGINLDKSKYTEAGGNFCFELSQAVEARWIEIFRQKIHDGNSFYYTNTPHIKSEDTIIASASFEDEHTLEYVLKNLKRVVNATNDEFRLEIEAQEKAEQDRQEKRLALEGRVQGIVNSLDFS